MFFIWRVGMVLSEETTVTVPTPNSLCQRLRLVVMSRTRYKRISSSLMLRKPTDKNSRSSDSAYRVKLSGIPRYRFRSFQISSTPFFSMGIPPLFSVFYT